MADVRREKPLLVYFVFVYADSTSWSVGCCQKCACSTESIMMRASADDLLGALESLCLAEIPGGTNVLVCHVWTTVSQSTQW